MMAPNEEVPEKKLKTSSSTLEVEANQAIIKNVKSDGVGVPLGDENNSSIQTNLVDLPDEVLLEIFKCLSLADRMSVRLVSERFYEICNTAEVLNTEYLVFFYTFLKQFSTTLKKSKRKWFSLQFRAISFSGTSRGIATNWLFESKVTEKIRVLYFVDCSFDKGFLENIIINCQNLTHLTLKLDDFEGVKKIDLPDGENIVRTNLVFLEIKVPAYSWVSEPCIPRIARIFPRLKDLRITVHGDRYEAILYTTGYFLSPTSSICSGIHGLAESIEELSLDFRYSMNLANFMDELSKFLFSLKKLRKLSLWVGFIREPSLKRLSELQRLESIQLTGIEHSSPTEFLSFLSDKLPNLKHVCCEFIRVPQSLTFDIFDFLMNTRWITLCLNSINVASFVDHANSENRSNYDQLTNKTMRALMFNNATLELPVPLSFFARFPYLEHLEINIKCDDNLNSICEYNPNLRSLIVIHGKVCPYERGFVTTDTDSMNRTKNDKSSLSRLEYLEIRNEYTVCDFTKKILQQVEFPNLRYFVTIGDIEVKTKIFLPILETLHNLEGLSLRNFKWSTHKSNLQLLSELSVNLKSLRYLSFYANGRTSTKSNKFNDSVYRGLFQSYPNLRVVYHRIYREFDWYQTCYVKNETSNEVKKIDVKKGRHQRGTPYIPAIKTAPFSESGSLHDFHY